jgi:hypothetical protein
MLGSRDDIFDTYSEAGFERAFAEHLELRSKEPVGDSGRILYLYERR